MKARVLFPFFQPLSALVSRHRPNRDHSRSPNRHAGLPCVALTGMVVSHESNSVVVEYDGGDVRVHVPNTVQWYEAYKKRAIDGLDVGAHVTVYGKIMDGRHMPKIEAEAIYFPEYDRLFFTDAQKSLALGEHVIDRLKEEYVAID